jgi:hypothetical protein
MYYVWDGMTHIINRPAKLHGMGNQLFCQYDFLQGGLFMRNGIFLLSACLVLLPASVVLSCPDVNEEAHDFCLKEVNLGNICLSDQQGSVVLLNFWESF